MQNMRILFMESFLSMVWFEKSFKSDPSYIRYYS